MQESYKSNSQQSNDTQLFLQSLRQRGIMLRLVGDELKIRAPKGTVSPDLINKIKEYKSGIIKEIQSSLLAIVGDELRPLPWTVEQTTALLAKYPDDNELWNYAWDWADKSMRAGASDDYVRACIDTLENEWPARKNNSNQIPK